MRAGYSSKTAGQIAYELLKKPDIDAAVREGETRIAADAQMTREKVLAELKEAIAMARLKNDPMAMIAGWREVAKILWVLRARAQQGRPQPRRRVPSGEAAGHDRRRCWPMASAWKARTARVRQQIRRKRLLHGGG